MTKIDYISPRDLQDDDVLWIVKACHAVKWKELNPTSVVHGAIEGGVGIYRISGNCTGIFVASVDGEEMVIECLAGKGLLKHFKEVHDGMVVVARSIGMTRISGMVARKALQNLYDTLTQGRPVATLYVENLDGRT